jgi:hypothetical protein
MEHLREQLAQALAAKQGADTAAALARADRDRAESHVAKCQRRLSEYEGLHDEITAETIVQLRDVGRAVELSDGLRGKVAELDAALIEAAAAERALAQLEREHAEAAGVAAAASRAAETTIAAILMRHAESLAWRHLELLAEAGAVRQSLLAANHALANKGVFPPGIVLQVLGTSIPELARVQDTGPWQRAAEALRADPRAEVAIALPQPRPVLPPVPAAVPWPPKLMVPIAPPPPPDAAE